MITTDKVMLWSQRRTRRRATVTLASHPNRKSRSSPRLPRPATSLPTSRTNSWRAWAGWSASPVGDRGVTSGRRAPSWRFEHGCEGRLSRRGDLSAFLPGRLARRESDYRTVRFAHLERSTPGAWGWTRQTTRRTRSGRFLSRRPSGREGRSGASRSTLDTAAGRSSTTASSGRAPFRKTRPKTLGSKHHSACSSRVSACLKYACPLCPPT